MLWCLTVYYFGLRYIECVSFCVACAHQSAAAQQDHEDDECFEPAVLHYMIAGLSKPPPHLAQTPAGVDITALEMTEAH